jgi:hypothetical protein
MPLPARSDAADDRSVASGQNVTSAQQVNDLAVTAVVTPVTSRGTRFARRAWSRGSEA